jgi:hypothetical protein
MSEKQIGEQHMGGGIRCLGGVIIPSQPVTPTMSPVLDRECGNIRHQHQCSNSCFTLDLKYQARYGSLKVFNYRLYHCNSQRNCETLISNETVEIP